MKLRCHSQNDTCDNKSEIVLAKRSKSRFFSRILKFFFIAGASFFVFSILEVLLLRWINPPTTPLMIFCRIQYGFLDYTFVPLKNISPFLQQAVQAAEDQNFINHHGFDFDEMQKAMKENQKRKHPRGASTISMQMARNQFLWQGKNYLRKGLEAYYTLLIELILPKSRIMEIYLNIAEWGKGTFGAEAAAQKYFHIPAAKLSKSQAAILAAILPNPIRLSANSPGPYILSRRDNIMDQMDNFESLH
jgi:monofunctional glycosyltransferase